jgi:hypothetical protein
LSHLQKIFGGWNLSAVTGLSVPIGVKAMLVERGMRVMNVGVVSEAYAIASNYLRRTGAICPHMATDDRLLEIIVRMFERGEFNKIRLANKAIARFEAEQPDQPKRIPWKPPSTAS